MSQQQYAIDEALRLKSIMTRRGVACTVELKAGRPWSGDIHYSRKFLPMNHHTAGSMRGLTPSYALCRNGRSDLPGPLCNGYGGRDFVYRIITLGLGNHPGQGGPLTVDGFTIPKDSARISCWGTEWEHNGTSLWPADMREFMARANAGLLEWMAVGLRRSIEHSTWTPRKIDRNTYTAARGQAEIAPFLNQEEIDVSPEQDALLKLLPDIHRELTTRLPNRMGVKGPDGKVGTDTLFGTALWAQHDAWMATQASRQAVALIGALQATVAALTSATLSDKGVTTEEITEAAKTGAAAALEERIERAHVEFTPKP